MDGRKLGGLLSLMAGGAALFPEEAEGAVYSKDGRRLLNLLDNAAKGALSPNEPVFEFQERLPKSVFKDAKEDNNAFLTRRLAASGRNIQHYWDARHNQMSNEEIEDLVESLTTGKDRFYVRANRPFVESVAFSGEKTGGRGSLQPSEEITYLYQVNPLSNKRLDKMKKIVDGSKAFPPFLAGGTGAAVLAPDKAQAASLPGGSTVGESRSLWEEAKRGFLLGSRNVLEGLGRGLTLGVSDPGKVLSDALDLPVPETGLEKNMAAFEHGASEVVPTIAGGMGIAKMAASPVTRAVGGTLASSPKTDMALGGILGLLGNNE